MHGIFEWLFAAFIGTLGFTLNKWAPLKKIRYYVYAVIFSGTFIFDLNNFSFTSDTVNTLLYLSVLIAITELVWLCASKKNKYLLGAALTIFVPIFIFIYTTVLAITPFPCHENKNVTINKYTCASESYILKKRPNLDPFEPGHTYTLYRSIPRYPIVKRIDKYTTPKGFYSAHINPKQERLSDGIKIDLYVDDSYVLWSLVSKKQ